MATDAYGSQIKKLKDHIYRAGYEYGMNMAAVPDDFELFTITIFCPPDALVRFDPNANEKEDDDEEDVGDAGNNQ